MARILLVDDSSLARAKYGTVLARLGHEVETAVDGDDCVARYRQLRPDLVLCDMNMPGKNGMEVIRELISLDPGARIIVFSAVVEPKLLTDAVQAGARDCFLKPVAEKKLAESIAAALGKK